MPYTAKQKRLFEAAKHNPAFARRVGMSHETAVKLSHEAETTRTRPPVKLKRKAKAERG